MFLEAGDIVLCPHKDQKKKDEMHGVRFTFKHLPLSAPAIFRLKMYLLEQYPVQKTVGVVIDTVLLSGSKTFTLSNN